MKMNMEALKALKLKLDEYRKENGAIAEHESANANCRSGCMAYCSKSCTGTCKYVCADGPTNRRHERSR